MPSLKKSIISHYPAQEKSCLHGAFLAMIRDMILVNWDFPFDFIFSESGILKSVPGTLIWRRIPLGLAKQWVYIVCNVLCVGK
jgi:hypothetical protein